MGIVGTIALLSLALAAVCTIIGARDAGGRILERAAGMLASLALLYCLVRLIVRVAARIARATDSLPRLWGAVPTIYWLGGLGFAVLVGIGLLVRQRPSRHESGEPRPRPRERLSRSISTLEDET